MKNSVKAFILIQLLLLSISTRAYSVVYEASSLYNAVSRAETVQDIYLGRWAVNREKNFYFDLTGKINTVSDFEVNTYNSGSGKFNVTPLDLTRTYGSVTAALPLTGFREDTSGSDFVIALDTAGYHYGLTRDVDLPAKGVVSGVVTDYKFSQFFDDIFALSILWRPYVIFHGGVIISNEYLPEGNGTLKYSDPVNSLRTNFFSADIMGIISMRMNLKGKKSESVKTGININPIAGMFADVSNVYYPVVSVGYENSSAYNDEPYDAVWVNSTSGKSEGADFEKDSARLNIFSVTAAQKISVKFSAEGFCAFQFIGEDIYSKTDNEKIDPPLIKEWYVKLKYDPTITRYGVKSDLYFGISRLWDPSVSMQRDDVEKGDGIYGFILGYDIDLKHIGGEIKTGYNFSGELKTLIESADKFTFEASLFVRI